MDETIENMGVFNQTVADSGIADLIAAQNQQLFTLKSYSSAPYTSLLSRNYYRSTAFKDDVAEYTQAIHSRGRRKVKLQNQLAKQLAESRYSGISENKNYNPLDNPIIKGTKDILSTAVIEKIGNDVEDKVIQKGSEKAAQKGAEIFANRYSTVMSNGKIMGMTPEATKAATEAAENSIKGTSKAIGKGLSAGIGLIAGVGIDILDGDSVEEAWGKEITTGVIGGLIMGALSLAGVSTPIGWGIAIEVGINYANEWARETFPEVKKFEDNVGRAVVSSWNNMVNGAKGLFSW